MRIFFIGFMGVGKSYWGSQLGTQLDIPFFDLDQVITASEGKSIADIFTEKGEEYFRIKEKECLEKLVAENEQFVISTGGGTPCYFNNIVFMKAQGTVIWLNTPVPVLVKRLLNEKQHRPLIKDLDDAHLELYINKKLADRSIWYSQADAIVAEEYLDMPTLLDTIAQRAE
jgi:shikimate kinase